jgi:hypothetical protein
LIWENQSRRRFVETFQLSWRQHENNSIFTHFADEASHRRLSAYTIFEHTRDYCRDICKNIENCFWRKWNLEIKNCNFCIYLCTFKETTSTRRINAMCVLCNDRDFVKKWDFLWKWFLIYFEFHQDFTKKKCLRINTF